MATERERWAREIATRRKDGLKVTQVQLAALLTERAERDGKPGRVRQSDISAWERGEATPPDRVKAELIAVLGIDPARVAPDWVRPLLKAAA